MSHTFQFPGVYPVSVLVSDGKDSRVAVARVEVELAVHDTWSGETWTYRNPPGAAFRPVQDTSAFATCEARSSQKAHKPTVPVRVSPSLRVAG